MHLIRVGSRFLCATAMCVVANSLAHAQDYGAIDEGPGSFNVTNPEGQVIEGTKSGIYSDGSSLSVDNARVIRGNGSYGKFAAAPDGGIVIAGGSAHIDNSGRISGQRFGITTAYVFNPQSNQLDSRAIGSTVSNSGSIADVAEHHAAVDSPAVAKARGGHVDETDVAVERPAVGRRARPARPGQLRLNHDQAEIGFANNQRPVRSFSSVPFLNMAQMDFFALTSLAQDI